MGFKRQGARRLAGPLQVAGAAATIYAPAEGLKAVIRFLHVQNPSGAAVFLTLSVGLDAAGLRVLDSYPIPAHSVKAVPVMIPLTTGEPIQAFASAAATLTITLMGEQTADGFFVLPSLIAIGNCELLLDAISGMVGNGTNVTAITDLSGHNRTVSLPSAPLFDGTKWNGSQPGLQYVRASAHNVVVASLSLADPFSVVTLVQDYAGAGATQDDIWLAGGAEAYCDVNGPAMLTGSPFGAFGSASMTRANSQGRRIFISVVNGASSVLARGSTEQAGTLGSPVSGAALELGGSAHPMEAGAVSLHAVYSKALSPTERALVVSLLQARYSSINPT